MKIIEYFNSDRQAHWLSQIKKSDWGAGQYLYQLLDEGKLQDAVGENVKVLLLTEGDELISFCTYAEKDDIQPTDLTPWIDLCILFQNTGDTAISENCSRKSRALPNPRMCMSCTYQQTIQGYMRSTDLHFSRQ